MLTEDNRPTYTAAISKTIYEEFDDVSVYYRVKKRLYEKYYPLSDTALIHIKQSNSKKKILIHNSNFIKWYIQLS